MKKVAVFGNAGGGKSTLSKRLAETTALPLSILDKIQFSLGGLRFHRLTTSASIKQYWIAISGLLTVMVVRKLFGYGWMRQLSAQQ